ncbi:MAG TPA: hypothetical protein VEI82_06755, partial [Myxococcota bacterium]|nr:hypothetical protein [Myxococcota bacterium]
ACDSGERGSGPATAPPPQAEENLAELVPSLVDALQAKQPAFVLDHVSHAFKEDGGLDYYDVRALVEKYTLGEEPVGARLEQVDVTPESDARQRVAARVSFALGQRLAAGEPLPEGGVVYALEVVFAKDGPRWQAVGGRYRRVSPPATSPGTPDTITR